MCVFLKKSAGSRVYKVDLIDITRPDGLDRENRGQTPLKSIVSISRVILTHSNDVTPDIKDNHLLGDWTRKKMANTLLNAGQTCDTGPLIVSLLSAISRLGTSPH